MAQCLPKKYGNSKYSKSTAAELMESFQNTFHQKAHVMPLSISKQCFKCYIPPKMSAVSLKK
jgi:hypothetical protein